VLQYVTALCVSQCDVVYCVMQCVAVCCNVLQCVAVCCSMLQHSVCLCISAYASMGWLMSVGSIKLYFSFAKEPHKRDDILQKRPMIQSILLNIATPPYKH